MSEVYESAWSAELTACSGLSFNRHSSKEDEEVASVLKVHEGEGIAAKLARLWPHALDGDTKAEEGSTLRTPPPQSPNQSRNRGPPPKSPLFSPRTSPLQPPSPIPTSHLNSFSPKEEDWDAEDWGGDMDEGQGLATVTSDPHKSVFLSKAKAPSLRQKWVKAFSEKARAPKLTPLQIPKISPVEVLEDDTCEEADPDEEGAAPVGENESKAPPEGKETSGAGGNAELRSPSPLQGRKLVEAKEIESAPNSRSHEATVTLISPGNEILPRNRQPQQAILRDLSNAVRSEGEGRVQPRFDTSTMPVVGAPSSSVPMRSPPGQDTGGYTADSPTRLQISPLLTRYRSMKGSPPLDRLGKASQAMTAVRRRLMGTMGAEEGNVTAGSATRSLQTDSNREEEEGVSIAATGTTLDWAASLTSGGKASGQVSPIQGRAPSHPAVQTAKVTLKVSTSFLPKQLLQQEPMSSTAPQPRIHRQNLSQSPTLPTPPTLRSQATPQSSPNRVPTPRASPPSQLTPTRRYLAALKEQRESRGTSAKAAEETPKNLLAAVSPQPPTLRLGYIRVRQDQAALPPPTFQAASEPLGREQLLRNLSRPTLKCIQSCTSTAPNSPPPQPKSQLPLSHHLSLEEARAPRRSFMGGEHRGAPPQVPRGGDTWTRGGGQGEKPTYRPSSPHSMLELRFGSDGSSSCGGDSSDACSEMADVAEQATTRGTYQRSVGGWEGGRQAGEGVAEIERGKWQNSFDRWKFGRSLHGGQPGEGGRNLMSGGRGSFPEVAGHPWRQDARQGVEGWGGTGPPQELRKQWSNLKPPPVATRFSPPGKMAEMVSAPVVSPQSGGKMGQNERLWSPGRSQPNAATSPPPRPRHRSVASDVSQYERAISTALTEEGRGTGGWERGQGGWAPRVGVPLTGDEGESEAIGRGEMRGGGGWKGEGKNRQVAVDGEEGGGGGVWGKEGGREWRGEMDGKGVVDVRKSFYMAAFNPL